MSRTARTPRAHWALPLTVLCIGSCAEPTPPIAWLGSTAHLHIAGVNEGLAVDRDIADPALLQMANFHCERTYEVPEVGGVPDPSAAKLVKLTTSFFFLSDSRPRTFTIALDEHDFTSTPTGTTLRVTPERAGVVVGADELIYAMAIQDFLLDETYLSAAAKIGDVTVHELSGTAPAGSTIIPEGDGSLGFTFDVVFHPEGYFRGSITAPCTVNHLVPVQP